MDLSDDGFDMSDSEYESLPDSFARRGARDIKKMLAQPEGQLESLEEEYDNVPTRSGSLSTRLYEAKWINQWNAFFAKVLKKQPGTIPIGKDIGCFLLQMSKILKPQSHKSDAIAHKTMTSGYAVVKNAIKLQHDNFKLTYAEEERIKSLFETLIRNGITTRKPSRKPLWVPARTVARLTLGLFQDGIINKTHDWTALVGDSLSLALLSAIGCRLADIARLSEKEKGIACLCYKHVEIMILPTLPVEGHEIGDIKLKAKIAFAFTADDRDDYTRNRVILLNSVGDTDISGYHTADPLKLIIIQALRTRAIAGAKTFAEAIEITQSYRDKTIRWAFPERPLLCAYGQHGSLLLEVPAATSQIEVTLNRAAKICGIPERLHPHDIRRGAAADISRLPRIINNRDNTSGHSDTVWDFGYAQRLALEAANSLGLQPFDADVLPQRKGGNLINGTENPSQSVRDADECDRVLKCSTHDFIEHFSRRNDYAIADGYNKMSV